ncbi:4-hydroxy-tetrahydrodipicolinate synthase [Fusarium oxysporum f. sp. albedinis]|nr:4-hydroxy-tetrahydrodipicolinate synthase [Fusarium oxysporum f. sp. albedinis]
MGLECRIMDTNDLEKVEAAIDERTKFVFTETISNPKFVPARFGVDIIIHSATKCIGGHRTTLGGVVIEGSQLQGEILEGSCLQAAFSTPMALLVIYSITSTI